MHCCTVYLQCSAYIWEHVCEHILLYAMHIILYIYSTQYLLLSLHSAVLLKEPPSVPKLLRLDEVHQRPQLIHVVLQRCASHQYPMLEAVLLSALLHDSTQTLQQPAVEIAQSVSFINNNAAPWHISQLLEVSDEVIVGGQQHMELQLSGAVLQ